MCFVLHISRQQMSFPLVMFMFLHFLMSGLGKTELNITTDQAALLQLKAHITSDPHNFFAHNWSTSESPCNWVGVTCSARHRRVTDLNLPDMSFVGAIPPHIGNLSFLAFLNLSGNNFQGHLPKELWKLRRLKIIDLSYNSLSGSLPGDICKTNFPELIWLDSNDISGQLPTGLGDCSKLTSLFLTENKFTGRIPHSIGNLTQLTDLFLYDNSLEGTIPQSIFNISSLEGIVLSNNSLSGSLPADLCHSLPSLDVLALNNNKLTGSIPKDIGNCTLLTILDLGQNHFTEYGLEGKVSIYGDVYSFGILLMETFTRKKPTDEIFVGEMSLKRWVEDSLPDAVTEVVDANLMSCEQDHLAAKKDCISSIMDLALKCSAEIPEERMNIKDAVITLKKIETKLLKDIQQA